MYNEDHYQAQYVYATENKRRFNPYPGNVEKMVSF